MLNAFTAVSPLKFPFYRAVCVKLGKAWRQAALPEDIPMFPTNRMWFSETSPVLLLPANVDTPESEMLVTPTIQDSEPVAESLYVDVPGLEELVRAIQQATDEKTADEPVLPSWEELEAELDGAEERAVRDTFSTLREADQRLQSALFAAESNLKQAQELAEQELTKAKDAVQQPGEQVRQISARADAILTKAAQLLSEKALAVFRAQV